MDQRTVSSDGAESEDLIKLRDAPPAASVKPVTQPPLSGLAATPGLPLVQKPNQSVASFSQKPASHLPELDPTAKRRSVPLSSPPSAPARRRWLATAGTLLLIPLVPRSARAANIVAVRTWPAAEYTRVTLELDSALKAEHFLLQNPHRLVLDLHGADLNAQLRDLISKIQPNDPYIASVRVGQNQPGVVRLVFDLKQPIVPQVFTLKPIAEYQHRLVLDLYPTMVDDPLMALLAEDDDPIARVIDELRTSPGSAPPPSASAGQPRPPAPKLREQDSTTEAILRSTRPPRPSTPSKRRQITVMIDPGHGGEDPGAIGPGGTREKDVVLQVARRLKARIDRQPGMRALLTRDGDYFVPLNARVLKARRAQADLFISIHADAFTRRSANGSSVYALSQRGASSASAQWLANKENAADLIGGINIRSQDQLIAKVLLDLSTTAQINDSLKLGSFVLERIGRINRLHKPRVEQAGFAVLKAPDIPSILVETAFISNPEEERKLRTPRYQEQMANAIQAGMLAYLEANPPVANINVASN